MIAGSGTGLDCGSGSGNASRDETDPPAPFRRPARPSGMSNPPLKGVFGVPPGADLPAVVAAGLLDWASRHPPEALARAEVYTSNRLLADRLGAALSARGARLLPRLMPVGDLGRTAVLPGVPAPVSDLRRRLDLALLVGRLIETAPDLAPRAALWDLTDSLAALFGEMQDEDVPIGAIEALDPSDLSGHWERSLRFLRLVGTVVGSDPRPTGEERQALAVRALTDRWRSTPPAHPVLVVGSTGSRGTTRRLMEAVAALPQGVLILPGFDAAMPAQTWDALDDALGGEDHPQFRFRALCDRLGLHPARVQPWCAVPTAATGARNALVSLALRPAPVTDQWLDEGPALRGMDEATAGLSLVEAASPRKEALAIALRLRQAAEDGQTAILMTPDRALSRRVTAALDRWGIVPDDSAGSPLGLAPPGRFLRHLAHAAGRSLDSQGLVTLLRHPLTHSGGGRGPHQLRSSDLDLWLRRKGIAFPLGAGLDDWAATRSGDDGAQGWVAWLSGSLKPLESPGPRSLADHLARLRRVAEALAAGPGGDPAGALWSRDAGQEAQRCLSELESEASHPTPLPDEDFASLLDSVLAKATVRMTVQSDPRVIIRGPQEARAIVAPVVVLGGLNDGVWPAMPEPDPWLNRRLRHQAGLLVPERQVGLSAHDFQIAIAAPEVVLSRSRRDGEAETVPSRWLNRLLNLLDGLGAAGQGAVAAMRDRGADWIARAEALERVRHIVPAAPRPAPAPPVAARPRELPVTAIPTLIRDPYAVYARYVLRLRRLDPLSRDPDARLRGIVVHRVAERFLRHAATRTPETFLDIANQAMEADVPWPAARRVWAARLAGIAPDFLRAEASRPGSPVLLEQSGALPVGATDFVLTARPDRIDLLPDGRARIVDYKTGALPTPAQIAAFEKQLPLEAAMAARGGFAALGPVKVAEFLLIRLGSDYEERCVTVTDEDDARVWEGLQTLVRAWQSPSQGYVARRAMERVRHASDYDHLARFGEWDLHHAAPVQPVGGNDAALGAEDDT